MTEAHLLRDEARVRVGWPSEANPDPDAVDGGARGGLGEEVGGVGQRIDQCVHVEREDGRGGTHHLRE